MSSLVTSSTVLCDFRTVVEKAFSSRFWRFGLQGVFYAIKRQAAKLIPAPVQSSCTGLPPKSMSYRDTLNQLSFLELLAVPQQKLGTEFKVSLFSEIIQK